MPGRLAYFIYRSIWTGLDFLYPPRCASCRTSGSRWCKECLSKVVLVPQPVCVRCGIPWLSGKLCTSCQYTHPNFVALRSWALYQDPLRKVILQLKYHKDISLGDTLSHYLVSLFLTLNWSIDLITAVPLSLARLAERGYNQASLLARPLALSLGISYRPKALIKIRNTRAQVDLSGHERWKNVAGAFSAKRGIVFGKKVLVVDDVTTTGATMDACAKALLNAGAKEVYGLTLARSWMEFKNPTIVMN